MDRYSVIKNKDPREIVLLKSYPCVWGKCSFCDYIDDNTTDIKEMLDINNSTLDRVTGVYKKLEVINSASVFELPEETLSRIRDIAIQKDIKTLVFEVYIGYKNRLDEIKNFFEGIEVEFKTGIETFDYDFRENVLNVGAGRLDIEELVDIFDVVCIMVGIKGQTKEMIKKDIELAEKFSRYAVNLYRDNSTDIKRDQELINWFIEEYSYLEERKNVDILISPTDFGVGD